MQTNAKQKHLVFKTRPKNYYSKPKISICAKSNSKATSEFER